MVVITVVATKKVFRIILSRRIDSERRFRLIQNRRLLQCSSVCDSCIMSCHRFSSRVQEKNPKFEFPFTHFTTNNI